MELVRPTHTPTHLRTHQTMDPAPARMDPVPTNSGGLPIQSASTTSLKRHAQRLRSLSQRMHRQRMERALQPSNTSSVMMESEPGFTPLPQTPSTTTNTPTTTPSVSTPWSWVPRLLRMWLAGGGPGGEGVFGPNQHPHPGSPSPWWQEIDADIAWSLTHYLESCMGVPATMLTDSVGLRVLLQRHLQWLQMTPEWMQLIGLLLAKRWRHRCGGSDAIVACPYATALDTSPHEPPHHEGEENPLPEEESTEPFQLPPLPTEDMSLDPSSSDTHPIPPSTEAAEPTEETLLPPAPPPQPSSEISVVIDTTSVRSVEKKPSKPRKSAATTPRRPRAPPDDLPSEENEEALPPPLKPMKKRPRPPVIAPVVSDIPEESPKEPKKQKKTSSRTSSSSTHSKRKASVLTVEVPSHPAPEWTDVVVPHV